MTDTTTFKVQINGGHEQSLVVKTGQYTLAAIAALALLDYEQADDYDVVKIWVPDLIDAGYGPYFTTSVFSRLTHGGGDVLQTCWLY